MLLTARHLLLRKNNHMRFMLLVWNFFQCFQERLMHLVSSLEIKVVWYHSSICFKSIVFTFPVWYLSSICSVASRYPQLSALTHCCAFVNTILLVETYSFVIKTDEGKENSYWFCVSRLIKYRWFGIILFNFSFWNCLCLLYAVILLIRIITAWLA